MKFSYACDKGHSFTVDFAPGNAPESTSCLSCIGAHGGQHYARRDYSADFASHSVNTGDPFRSYHLSTKKDKAAAEQQRKIGGPTDNFERKRDERERGIKYVGSDTSGMTANARRGIELAKEKMKK